MEEDAEGVCVALTGKGEITQSPKPNTGCVPSQNHNHPHNVCALDLGLSAHMADVDNSAFRRTISTSVVSLWCVF